MSFRSNLLEVVKAEWEFFDRDKAGQDHVIGGVHKEAFGKYNKRVARYWSAIPSSSYETLKKKFAPNQDKIDGRTPLAWSAAFISFCMKEAGADKRFPYSSGHATWIVASIKNFRADKLTANLVGYRPGVEALQLGDIVGYWRGKNATSYSNAVAKGWFESHTDIVVGIDKAKKIAYTIGGNVGQSVARTEVPISSSGKLVGPPPRCIVHIRNNIA